MNSSVSSPTLARRADFILLTVFWAYVTLTNVLWGTSMRASLAASGITHIFSSWDARLTQHLVLFPALIASIWLSGRIAWRPLWRAVPLQVILGVGFSALGDPAMDIARALAGVTSWHDIRIPGLRVVHEDYPGAQVWLWVASIATFLLNYAFALALLSGFDFYRRYRDAQVRTEGLERSLSAAHLAALRMQLSPHTLFNLLHTIRGHVAWDPGAAQQMIVQLGDLLRRVLRAGEHEFSRLQDEVEFVRLYLQLQQRRFADRLVIEVPDSDTLPAVWVPSLILQPLVENAVVHGLAQPQTQVTVLIEVVMDAEILVLRIINSMPPLGVATEQVHSGIGLKNVQERLAIQFEERGTCQSRRITPSAWLAELRLPILVHGT